MMYLVSRLVFWGWNIIFLLFAVLFVLTGLAWEILTAVLIDEIPVSFFLALCLVFVVPVVAMYLALKRKAPDNSFYLRFFFGVEVPIFILAFLRLFVLRQLSFGSGFLLISILAACAYFAWVILQDDKAVRSRLGALLHAVPAGVLLTIGLLAGLYLAIFALPASVGFIEVIADLIVRFFRFDWIGNLDRILATSLYGVFFLVSAALFLVSTAAFIVAPLFIGFYYATASRDILAQGAARVGVAVVAAVSLISAGGWLWAHNQSGQQPEALLIEELANAPDLTSIQQFDDEDLESIRVALTHGYLYRYRYLHQGDALDGVKRMYRTTLGLSNDAAASVQTLHNFIVSPFLYAGRIDDNRRASRLYEAIFDAPVQEAEREAVKRALEATWNRSSVEAGLLDVNSEKVLIDEQRITYEDLGDYATVEIEEVYSNTTFTRQEIYYYFSLPEDAAITGLWLGLGPDRARHDAHILAPRGAAQAIYEREVQRRIDPALLEQVGPNQYRLRAFPVPTKRSRFEDPAEGDERLRMYFTYVVPRSDKGFALPSLLERRNVFWSPKTLRSINGETYKETDWLPASLSARGSGGLADLTVALEDDVELTRTVARDLTDPLRLAVLVDTSYSMRQAQDALIQTLQQLSDLQNVDSTVIVLRGDETAPVTYDPGSMSAQTLPLYGSLTSADMLRQFIREYDGEAFDGVVVLTDQGAYARKSQSEAPLSLDVPLWFVHVNRPAFAYDDDVLDTIYRTGGGASLSITDMVQRLRSNRAGNRRIGTSVWTVGPAGESDDASPAQIRPVKELAARQLIFARSEGAKPGLATLDAIHRLATTYDIVTPWSSMLVLVNERQKQELAEELQKDDRFDRESNSGKEGITMPGGQVFGVPEPETWMLIGISVLSLFGLNRRRKAFGA